MEGWNRLGRGPSPGPKRHRDRTWWYIYSDYLGGSPARTVPGVLSVPTGGVDVPFCGGWDSRKPSKIFFRSVRNFLETSLSSNHLGHLYFPGPFLTGS